MLSAVAAENVSVVPSVMRQSFGVFSIDLDRRAGHHVESRPPACRSGAAPVARRGRPSTTSTLPSASRALELVAASASGTARSRSPVTSPCGRPCAPARRSGRIGRQPLRVLVDEACRRCADRLRRLLRCFVFAIDRRRSNIRVRTLAAAVRLPVLSSTTIVSPWISVSLLPEPRVARCRSASPAAPS